MRFKLPSFAVQIVIYMCVVATTASAGPVIGIFGDVHGNEQGMQAALQQMKASGVEYIIGTGDFIGWGNAAELDKLLSQINTTTGVPRERTFLMPGNWEHEAAIQASEANAVLKRHGNLINERYDGYGIIQVEGIKIMVSHFPQHPIPEQNIPPRQFLRRIPNQAFVLDTMKHNVYPAADVEFEIFAHNHIRSSYVDPTSQKLVINAGVIDPKTRAPTEKRAFAIYDGATKNVVFYGIDTGEVIAKANTKDRTVTAETLSGLIGCRRLREDFNAL